MNDTSPDINAQMIKMFQARKPEERLVMGCAMYDFAKKLVISSVLDGKDSAMVPGILKRELFLRFYGQDFDDSKRQKIAEYLTCI